MDSFSLDRNCPLHSDLWNRTMAAFWKSNHGSLDARNLRKNRSHCHQYSYRPGVFGTPPLSPSGKEYMEIARHIHRLCDCTHDRNVRLAITYLSHISFSKYSQHRQF